jgi:hypothetical protein
VSSGRGCLLRGSGYGGGVVAGLSAWRTAAGDRALRRLPVSVRRRWFYLRVHGRWLRLHRPVRFSEKVNWRIARDDRAVLAGTCDKLAMKVFARQCCGDLPLRVPLTYWSGTDIGQLAAVELPARWVIKPNHRSGLVLLGGGAPDIPELRAQTRGWLHEVNWSLLGEWAYRDAQRAILVEEWIGAAEATPTDYKVFVFHGEPRIVQVDENRHADLKRRFYTADWTPLPTISGSPPAPAREAPPELGSLLAIAARLGRAFDYMRVDLYIAGSEIWFGELTPYPGGGLVPFRPADLDVTMGGWWQLPSLPHRGRG